MDDQQLGKLELQALIDVLRQNKRLAEAAIEQVPDDKLHQKIHPETNSIAVIVKHVAGNLRSRWTDFLTSDGEKPDRRRDNEFVDDDRDRQEVLADWESGWRAVFDAIEALRPEDLLLGVEIRGERMSVPHAINRSLSHTSYHIGQIVQAARILAGDDWRTLTIPRGESERFNRERWGRG